MKEEEKFLLDAEITGVISVRAFRARLRNGHSLVAFVTGASAAAAWVPGDRVRVELSPFDMSKGRVVGRAPGEDGL